MACSAIRCSRAITSRHAAAPASHTVVAPSKARCWSSRACRSPGLRATLPTVGLRSPVMSLKIDDFPAPLRPMMPHRSPSATVKVTFSKSLVAPNEMPTLEQERSVTRRWQKTTRRRGRKSKRLQPSTHLVASPVKAAWLSQVLVEERDRPLPRQLRRRLVVARRRVVVEAVLRAGIEEALVPDAGRLERLLERGPARVDALVHLGRLDQQRSLDLRNVLDVRGRTIERHAAAE